MGVSTVMSRSTSAMRVKTTLTASVTNATTLANKPSDYLNLSAKCPYLKHFAFYTEKLVV